jgi:hypothetical protein
MRDVLNRTGLEKTQDHIDLRRKPPAMTSVQKLVAKLKAMGYKIPRGWKFQRFYPGHWQRSSGAWVWRIYWKYGEIGSPESVKACLKAKAYCRGPYNEIFPE